MLKLLWLLIFGRSCCHAWALVTDKDFPPRMEEFRKSGMHPTDATLHLEGCARTYFAVVKCDKCGALKTFEKTA